MRRLGTGLAIATLATLVAAGGAEPRTQRVELQRTIYSAAVKGPLRLAVYLPAGYATNGARYPVIYFLHGLSAACRA